MQAFFYCMEMMNVQLHLLFVGKANIVCKIVTRNVDYIQ